MNKLLIIFLLFATISFGQKSNRMDSVNNIKIEALNKKVSEVEKIFETERNINDKTFNSISTQISASSMTLTIISIAFALIAVFIGIYVTYVERKIVKIGEENREL